MRILYLGFGRSTHSGDGVYLKGLKENGAEVEELFYSKAKRDRYVQTVRWFISRRKKANLIIVGNTSPQLVVLVRFLTLKTIVYNALCSEYERMIVSRHLGGVFSVRAVYYWLLDFFAAHCASWIMLESRHQVVFFSRLFLVKQTKCIVAPTGVNDAVCFYDPAIRKSHKFTAVFRGRLLPEAGADIAVRAAKLLEAESVKIIMLANGMLLSAVQSLIAQLQPRNLELITDFLPDTQLRGLMLKSHISLGQLSNHPRLARTIPHKAYESLAMRLPYVTARNSGVMELLTERENCIAFKPGDAKDLADKILWARDHWEEAEMIAMNGYRLYESRLSPRILAKQLLEQLRLPITGGACQAMSDYRR